MNSLRKLLLLILVLGYISEVSAQDNKILKLSIDEAQKYALQNNRTVQSARIDVASMTKRVWESTSMGLPQLNLATNYQHQFVIPQLSFGKYLDVNNLPIGP